MLILCNLVILFSLDGYFQHQYEALRLSFMSFNDWWKWRISVFLCEGYRICRFIYCFCSRVSHVGKSYNRLCSTWSWMSLWVTSCITPSEVSVIWRYWCKSLGKHVFVCSFVNIFSFLAELNQFFCFNRLIMSFGTLVGIVTWRCRLV